MFTAIERIWQFKPKSEATGMLKSLNDEDPHGMRLRAHRPSLAGVPERNSFAKGADGALDLANGTPGDFLSGEGGKRLSAALRVGWCRHSGEADDRTALGCFE